MPVQPTILVIDDHPWVREQYRDLLEPAGFCVVEAGNGADALIWFLKHPADLIILDLRMPVLDGRSFLEYRMQLQRIRDIPVAVVSGWIDDVRLRRTLRRLGADWMLQKPIRSEDLLRVAHEALTRPRRLSVSARGEAPKIGGRQDARVAFCIPIHIRTPAAADISGSLFDLSAGGLGAYLPRRLGHGEPITVSLDIEGRSLALTGFVQWVAESQNVTGFRHGIRFAERQEETFPLHAYAFFHERPESPSPLGQA